jgi:hypothetical protein
MLIMTFHSQRIFLALSIVLELKKMPAALVHLAPQGAKAGMTKRGSYGQGVYHC